MPTLYLVWRGIANANADDVRLYWATSSDGHSWLSQPPLTERDSLHGPALAVFQNKLFMARRGTADDNLYWSTYDEHTIPAWSSQSQLTDRGSYSSPTLAVFQGTLFMAWRGASADQNLYWSTYDGHSWSSQHALTDRGSLEGPALAVFQGKLFMVWRGIITSDESDQNLYWSTYDEHSIPAWSPQSQMDGVASAVRPALFVFQDNLYIACINNLPVIPITSGGVAGDSGDGSGPDPGSLPPSFWFIYQTTFNGKKAHPTQLLGNGGASVASPALAVYANVPGSLKNFLLEHGFNPSRGVQEFIREFWPGVSSVATLMSG